MSGLFGGAPKPPPPPKVLPPAVQPDPEDPRKVVEGRRRAAKRIKGSGRAATFLSQRESTKLGGN